MRSNATSSFYRLGSVLEAVPMTVTGECALDGILRSLLRNALGIHFPETVSTRALMERSGLPPLSETLRMRRQRLLGHCLRSYGRSRRIPPSLVLLHAPFERFRRGQGRTQTLRSTFLKDLGLLGLTPSSTVSCSSSLFSQRVLCVNIYSVGFCSRTHHLLAFIGVQQHFVFFRPLSDGE